VPKGFRNPMIWRETKEKACPIIVNVRYVWALDSALSSMICLVRSISASTLRLWL
jgi:hypothetical protein